jgi:hypothetical protein
VTSFDDLVWHEDRTVIQWALCPRYLAYIGDWTLIVYERGEWHVSKAGTPLALCTETSFDRAKKRAFLVYQALTAEIA